MTSIIARRDSRIYLMDMGVALLRLVTLVALVLMSFTMTAAPAAARATPPAMAEGHCSDHPDQSPPMGDMAQCLLMCAALPAVHAMQVTPPDGPRAPLALSGVNSIHGIILEIATPPPRLG